MAVANRIGSFALIENTLRDVRSSQTQLAELQTQISSGYKSKDFEGINGSVEQFTLVTMQIDRAKQFNMNNQVSIAKLQTADGAMGKITEIADQMKNIILGANGATIRSSNIPQVMQDLIIAMANEMNATFNGSYLFGGVDTTNPPVPDPNASPTATGVPDANYYAGSTQNASLRADETTNYAFPVRADDVAFQKIYAAAKQAIEAARSGDTVTMGEAQQLIQSGQNDLIAARSRLATTTQSIQSIDSRLTTLKTYWTELADNVSKTDIVATSAQVSSYQAILQATYQIYARLSSLRLADYLK